MIVMCWSVLNYHFWVGYWLTLAQYSMTFKVYIMHNDSSKYGM